MRPFCVKNIKIFLSVAFQLSSDGHASRIIACRRNTATDDIAYQAAYNIKSVIAIVREYVFFQNPKNATFYVLLKCHVKKRKNVESVVQVFTFLDFEIANGHFHCKSITHMSCYNIILKLSIFG